MSHVENLPWGYRIVGIYRHKTSCRVCACIHCNICTSCSSQFSLLSILLNINKASKHWDCRRTITDVYGQCIRTMPMVFFALSNHWWLCGYIREGYLDCSLPSQNRWSVWNTSTKMSQASILSFFGSNLVEKGAQKHKSLDVTKGPSATKSPNCLSSNEDVSKKLVVTLSPKGKVKRSVIKWRFYALCSFNNNNTRVERKTGISQMVVFSQT